MKKVIVAVLMMLLSGNAYAKAYNVSYLERNQSGIIIGIKASAWGFNEKKYEKALIQARKVSNQHCMKYSSISYSFYSFGKVNYNFYDMANDMNKIRLNKNGSIKPYGKNVAGFIHDVADQGSVGGYYKLRFFCAKNLQDAINKFNNRSNIFSKKFEYHLNYGDTLRYANHLENTMVIKDDARLVRINFDNNAQTASSGSTQSSSSTKDKITQAKQICKDLGFKTNTEKFADCALKMMSMQFEAGNRVATSSGGTKQEITLKHKQDYDIFDAMIDVSNVMRQSNSSSSSGRGKCRIFQSAYHADLICR